MGHKQFQAVTSIIEWIILRLDHNQSAKDMNIAPCVMLKKQCENWNAVSDFGHWPGKYNSSCAL
jgi:hypothetical protein